MARRRRALPLGASMLLACSVLLPRWTDAHAETDQPSPAEAPVRAQPAPPGATPTSETAAKAAGTFAGGVGRSKQVSVPMPKPAALLPAFAPVRGTLHPRVRAAYEHATDTYARRQPECGLRWTILAAVGAIESANAAHEDGALVFEESGRVEPLILGPVLDGNDGRSRIADTDGGELDGDAEFDRAVGPMQFIPSTWTRHGRDGNGDGTVDPHSIDDASLAAAGYLCTAAAGDLREDEALDRALFSYNHSDAYVQAVRFQLARFDEEFGFGVDATEPPVPGTDAPLSVPSPTPPPPTTQPVAPTTTTNGPTTTVAPTTTTVPATTAPSPTTTVRPPTTTSSRQPDPPRTTTTVPGGTTTTSPDEDPSTPTNP